MTKELEALKDLCEFVNYCDEANEDVGVIEQALQRLEQIDNANPSKAITELANIKNTLLSIDLYSKVFINDDLFESLENIKQALLKTQEQEKVLDELLMLVNDLEPTFNSKGMVSIDDDNLGTFIKNYFLDNASDLLKRYTNND